MEFIRLILKNYLHDKGLQIIYLEMAYFRKNTVFEYVSET